MNKDYEVSRAKFWADVYIAYVGADNAIKKDGAISWADIALEAFDARFRDVFQESKKD